ncbi:hypothetical protein [Roseomonas genomospecies 6]|uniref:PRC-barrel domain containing protein n=1 Tax=Roseomonas genomospecies 6 TaxID=214106 RepID=A0A9W7NDT0_9PROT|nr:hypothetical protein [Roseomonas genomospecies 6]KAA0675859.1 hypothetical protein DS843_29720 [Roseomonas genomospecies 6]
MTHPRPNPRPTIRLLAVCALAALGACAETGDTQRPMARMSPLELVGLTVQSIPENRILGAVEDVVLTPAREPVQIVVASGAPVHPVKRHVTLDSSRLRYSGERQALVLTGMTADEFDALFTAPAAAVPTLAPLPGNPADATNWNRATAPR